MLPLSFHPEVHAEIRDAYEWYQNRRLGLGVEFMQALDEVFARLRRQPRISRVVYHGVRRVMPKRFPYAVIYRPLADRVEIIAVQHARRDPTSWHSRV